MVLWSANLVCMTQLRLWSKDSLNQRISLYQHSNQGKLWESLVNRLFYQQQHTVSRILVQLLIVRLHSFNMQWRQIELLSRSHNLSAYNHSRFSAHLFSVFSSAVSYLILQNAQQKLWWFNLLQPHKQISAFLLTNQLKSRKRTSVEAQLCRKANWKAANT